MTPPRRQLGFSIVAAIVIANMIGTGVFTSTGLQARALHDPATFLLAWIVGGVLALCGAAAYAELGAMMPEAGGEYVYLSRAYHPAVGFLSGWVSLTAGFSASIAVSAIAFATYLAKLVPALDGAAAWLTADLAVGEHHLFTIALGAREAVAIGLIVGMSALHGVDTRLGGWVQAGFTGSKVLLLVALIACGVALGHGDWNNLRSQHGGLANLTTPQFAMALMYVSFAYSGWNSAAYIAGEVVRPEKTLPRALLAGTGLVMAVYVLLNLVVLYAVPSDTLAGGAGGPVIEVGDAAARVLFGSRAAALVTSVIALALVSGVSAMMIAGPRIYAAMASDGALPEPLSRYSRRGVPTIAVVAQGVLAIVFVLVGDLGQLIRFVGFMLAIFAALTVGAVFVLRRRGYRAPYRTFGYPITPILFIAMSAWIAYVQVESHRAESLVVVGVLALGAALYHVFGRARPRSAAAAPDGLPEARIVGEPEA
ncbi:MAG TPA: amino acid permease [Kofleriaceae bacterium]|nr:amino acid permease [Kofleriaceae bacterium]